MAQNIVDISWDLAKFDEQTQAVLANMTKVYDLANQAKATGIKLGSDGGFTELKKNVVEFNKVQENTIRLTKLQESAEQARLKTQITAAKAAKEQEAAEQQRLKTQAQQLELTKKQTAANEKAAKAYNPANVPIVVTPLNNDELKNAGTLVNQVEQSEAAAAISAAEFGNSVNKSTTALNEQGEVSKKTSADIVRDKEIQKQVERQAAQEIKNSVREQLAAKGSLEQRRAALIRLNATYDQLNAKERESAYGVRLKNTIAGVTTQVKELEYATGRAQRNVGNYGSALSKFGTRLESVFRRLLAYVSIFAAFDFFKTVVSDTLDAEQAVERFRTTLENLGRSDVFGRLDSKAQSFTDRFKYLKKEDVLGVFEQLIDYGKLTEKQITDLLPVITNFAAKQRISITEAAPIIIKALAGQSRGLKQYGINVKDAHSVTERFGIIMDQLGPKVEGAADAFGKTTQGKLAQTKEDFVKLKEEIGNGLLPTINKLLTGFDNLINRFRTMHSDIDLNTSAFGRFLSKIQGLMPSGLDRQKIDDDLAALAVHKYGEKQMDHSGDHINTFILPPDTIPDANKILGTGGQDKDTTKTHTKAPILESVKNELNLEFELYKVAQQRKIKLLEEEQNDTKKSIMERVQLAEDYKNAQIELSDKTFEHEIANDKERLRVMEINFKRLKKGTEKNNLAVEIANTTKEITIAQSKQNDARLGLEDEFSKKFIEIEKDTEAERLRIFEEAGKAIENVYTEQRNAIEANRATEKASHDKLLHDKSISQDKYDKLEKKSIKENLILQLQADLKKAESARDLIFSNRNSTQEERNNATNAVTVAQGNLVSGQNQDDKSADEKKKEKIRAIEDTVKSTQDLINGLVDAGYQKEINAIQKIIDLNNQRKEQEISNINASTLSNQEKAAQMMILDNTVAANNKKLEREKVAIQIKQAKFDRDMAILGIIENAAIAEFTPPYSPWKAAAIAVEAAASIAMLLAKPLPQMPAYATGTDNHPGGPAIVGEGQYKELVTTPDGKSFIVDKPTFIPNLLSGSKVKPFKDRMDMINRDMYNSMVIGTAQRIQAGEMAIQKNSNKDIVDAIELGSIRTVQAMKKQKASHVTVNIDGNWGAYISKVVKE